MATAYIIDRPGVGWTILNIVLIVAIIYAVVYAANRYTPYKVFPGQA